MKPLQISILLALGLAVVPAYGQRKVPKAQKGPIEATVCKISEDPSYYNNKLVRVRGYVDGNFEYSLLLDEHCNETSIWFAFADGAGPPQLAVMIRGKGVAGSSNSKGRRIAPIPVHLIRDASFDALMHYLATSTKGKACAEGPPPDLPPDCTTYRVTATFTGRVDGVSRRLHEAHLKRSDADPTDGKGFGHMGMFDAEIVVQSVENVVAVEE